MDEFSTRLIVVDDLEDSAKTLALLLELDGYRVQVARNGAEAVKMIESFRPECILFDIDMPVMDGFELSKHVREHHRDDIVLIAMTARPRSDPRVAGAFELADHYFTKPIDHAQLQKLLRPH